MTNTVIIFSDSDGIKGVIRPTSDALMVKTLEQIAAVSVPSGCSYVLGDNAAADLAITSIQSRDEASYIATLTDSEAELYNLSKTRPNEVVAAKNEYNMRQREAVAAEILSLIS